MNIKAIKTAQTEAAVKRIKDMTKREVKDVCHEVPALFIEKRNYMQSAEFLKDRHNRKMFDLADDLVEYREKITNDTEVLNRIFHNKFIQAINGFIRLKKDIHNKPNLNFEEAPSFYTLIESRYHVVKNVQMFTESQKARRELNISI